jgi:hypothetical protein
MLTDAVRIYIERHQKRDVKDFVEDTERNWGNLVEVVGNKAFMDLTRDDARLFVENRLAKGLRTGSVRRQLTSITTEYKLVQAGKLLHRLAGGSHKRWDQHGLDGRKWVKELHKHTHSRGRVLLHLGRQLEDLTSQHVSCGAEL